MLGCEPPMRLLLALVIVMPGPLFPIAAVPAGLVPIRFPTTVLPVAGPIEVLLKRTPAFPLPEMTLPAPGVNPPTVLFEVPMATAGKLLGRAAVPLAFKPTTVPSTKQLADAAM